MEISCANATIPADPCATRAPTLPTQRHRTPMRSLAIAATQPSFQIVSVLGYGRNFLHNRRSSIGHPQTWKRCLWRIFLQRIALLDQLVDSLQLCDRWTLWLCLGLCLQLEETCLVFPQFCLENQFLFVGFGNHGLCPNTALLGPLEETLPCLDSLVHQQNLGVRACTANSCLKRGGQRIAFSQRSDSSLQSFDQTCLGGEERLVLRCQKATVSLSHCLVGCGSPLGTADWLRLRHLLLACLRPLLRLWAGTTDDLHSPVHNKCLRPSPQYHEQQKRENRTHHAEAMEILSSCTSTSSARSPCDFRLQADVTICDLRKL